MTQTHAEATLPFDDAIAAFDPVMGLEVHVELGTATKMFCGCPTEFGAEPNTQVCPVCLGLPGALPVVNAVAVESAIRIGLALNCEIAQWCRFARKNYFYPDMPKNFQTSQYDEPIAFEGYLDVELDDGTVYRVEIERAHMEEDTGKSLHVGGSTGRIHGATHSLVDYNRAGIPLIEIVTKPMTGAGERAPEIARAYVATLRDLLKALGVSDVRMEQGSMRCDVNLSLMPKGAELFGTRSETKNVNSLRSVERAVRYEMWRHARCSPRAAPSCRRPGTGTRTPGSRRLGAREVRRRRLPLLPRARPRAGGALARAGRVACGRRCPSRRRPAASGSRGMGLSDLEMRDVVNAGLVDLIEETVAAGGVPGGCAQVVVR
jgi:aspartyl-tRNA(Asn)/glutamyl-tRNA(Gln) amidotransferase subunit B